MRIHCGIFLGKWVSGGVEELAAKNAKGAKKLVGTDPIRCKITAFYLRILCSFF